MFNSRQQFGSIGWGVSDYKTGARRVLADQPHKQIYTAGQPRNNPQMELSGYFGESIDNWLGIPYHVLDSLSIREQRKIVSTKAR